MSMGKRLILRVVFCVRKHCIERHPKVKKILEYATE